MRRLPPRLLVLIACAGTAGPVAAQMAAPLKKAAETITEKDVAHRIGVIADDSMMGRDTPSRGLELTAQYIADQFKKFGLKPGGDSGTWLQRYPLPMRQLDFAQSRVVFAAGGTEVAAGFTTAARLAAPFLPEQPAAAGVLLVAGPQTAASIQQLQVNDKIVLFVDPATVPDSAVRQQILQQLFSSNKGLVILPTQDSATFATRLQSALQQNVVGIGPSWAALVWPPAISNVLTAAGVDLAQLRAATAPLSRDLSELTVRLEAKADRATAPNTVGILEGSDPKLRHEYLVFSAHMDHIGISRGRPDSINNGADDDASGTVGIVELAEAFSQPGARPRRSIIFLTVSGEEKGLWGSAYFAKHPPVPLQQVVANVNIDMIGRNWKDTVVAIGKEHSDLGATLNRVAAAHPELGVTAIDDLWPQEQFYFRSDHYNFARNGVPVLFFFTGVHPDYHQVSDSPEKIDAEKEARILRLVFYLGHEIAETEQRPKWNEESYRKIVKQ